MSRVLLGLSIAILVGNPLTTWLGQQLSWRTAFALVSVLAIATVAMIARFLLPDPDEVRTSPMRELRAFNTTQVWLALAIGAVGFAGMFCVFTYLAPTLVQVTGVAESWMPLAVGVFGIGAIIGNIAGGWLVDKFHFKAAAVVLLWSIVMLLLYPLAAQSVWTIGPMIITVGTMGALAAVLQTRLMDVAGEAQTLAAASNHAAFNTANALGPWLGGMAISAGFSPASTGYVGAATAIGGLLLWCVAVMLDKKRRPPSSAATEHRAGSSVAAPAAAAIRSQQRRIAGRQGRPRQLTALHAVQHPPRIGRTVDAVRPRLDVLDQGQQVRPALCQPQLQRLDVGHLLLQHRDQRIVLPLAHVRWQQGADLFQAEACALRAGDQLQQQHRLLRVVAVAIGLALHHQQPRVLIEADARRRQARAAGQLTDLHLPESSTSEPVDLQ
jgi:MFS family permease